MKFFLNNFNFFLDNNLFYIVIFLLWYLYTFTSWKFSLP